jgi:hypothetical protein
VCQVLVDKLADGLRRGGKRCPWFAGANFGGIQRGQGGVEAFVLGAQFAQPVRDFGIRCFEDRPQQVILGLVVMVKRGHHEVAQFA